MATPPDFTTGQVLTAAQMNAVGLWLVKTQTIGSAVSSVTVTDAFSADYEAYKVIITGGVGSTGVLLYVQLGASTTAYYWSLAYMGYGTSTVLGGTSLGGGGANFANAGYAKTSALDMNIELVNPSLAKYTFIQGQSWSYASGSAIGYSGEHRVATAYTDLVIGIGAGTMTGGTISVYGYRG